MKEVCYYSLELDRPVSEKWLHSFYGGEFLEECCREEEELHSMDDLDSVLAGRTPGEVVYMVAEGGQYADECDGCDVSRPFDCEADYFTVISDCLMSVEYDESASYYKWRIDDTDSLVEYCVKEGYIGDPEDPEYMKYTDYDLKEEGAKAGLK